MTRRILSDGRSITATNVPGGDRIHSRKCTEAGKAKCACPYRLRYRDAGGTERTIRRDTLDELKEAYGNLTGADRKRHREASRQPFVEAAAEWLDGAQGRTKRGLDDDTRDTYRSWIDRWFVPVWGNKPVREIGRKDCNLLIATMQRAGLKPTTIQRAFAGPRAMFSDLVDEGQLTANPALRLRINAQASSGSESESQEEDETKGRVLTEAEAAAVLTALPEPERLVFATMLETGLRVGEVTALEARDFEQREDGSLWIRVERQWTPKGRIKRKTKAGAGRARTIELFETELGRKLWAMAADSAGPIPVSRRGTRWNHRNLRRALDKAKAKAGVEDRLVPHDFRHTHGSWLISEDAWTIPEVSERLGHADPAITAKVYAHTVPGKRRAAESFGNLDHRWITEELKTAIKRAVLGN